MPRSFTKLTLFALLCLYGAAAVADDDVWRWSGVDRVVAFADVHGAYEELVALLKKTGVIDERLHWAGGKTHLVSTGDLVDRGSRSRDVMDLLMRLQQEASAAGGRVHVLLGNHELMNLTGDLRYVSPQEFLAFANEEPAGARAAALAEFIRGYAGNDPLVAQAVFDIRFPPGFFGLRAAFAPEGHYGKWLLERPLLIVIDRTAFTHGGLPPLVAELGLERINRELRSELTSYVNTWHRLMDMGLAPVDASADEALVALETHLGHVSTSGADEAEAPADGVEAPATKHVAPEPDDAEADTETERLARDFRKLAASDLLDDDGPLWYRGSALCHPLLESPVTGAALEKLGVDRVVVGHSPTADHLVDLRLGGRVVVLDTGMLKSHYEGVPAALVIQNDSLDIVYGAAAAAGGDDDALERILLEATVEQHDTETGLVTLRHGDHQMTAVFSPRRSNPNFRNEIAAYRLDRLLGLGLVAVTVERKIGRDTGALSLRPGKYIDELERNTRRIALPSWCSAGTEFDLMYAFDALVYNEGRTTRNMLYSGSSLSLQIVGFGRAFGNRRGIPAWLGQAELALGPELARRLAELDAVTLNRELKGLLSKGQINAIIKRRDEMLDTWPRAGTNGQSG